MSEAAPLPQPGDAEPKPKQTGAIPLWIRLPRPGTRCPYTGLSRGTMIELVLPCPVNGHRPPVRSVCLRKRGAQRGIRLVNGESLADYLDRLADEQASGDQLHIAPVEKRECNLRSMSRRHPTIERPGEV